MQISEVTVDIDILKFLRAIYFGAYTNLYEAASNRAYLDMNRTLRFHNIPNEERQELRKQVAVILEEDIRKVKRIHVEEQDMFDLWHFKICKKIKKKYVDKGIDFTIGQSQKWLNMTFKYLYILGDQELFDIFKYLHVPLDNYILDVAHNEFGFAIPKIAWSRWDNYKEEYLQYQNDLRAQIKGKDPLRWEFEYWLLEKLGNDYGV